MQFRPKQPLSTAKVPWLEKAKKVLAHRGLVHQHGARATSSLGLPKGHNSLHGKGKALLQAATPSKVATEASLHTVGLDSPFKSFNL